MLFLGSGDLRNAFFMATQCSEAYHELDIHLSDSSDLIVSRNILIMHIITSAAFNPKNSNDIQYLWELWYGFQWKEETKKRFNQNVKNLMAGQTDSSIVQHGAHFNQQLKTILKSWLETVNGMSKQQMKKIKYQR